MSPGADLRNGLASAAVLVALLCLLVAGLRLPVARAGWRRWGSQGLVILGAVALTLLANVALYRHDVHVDVTHERAFTPSPEAQRVVQGLTTDVDLLYFYQKQHPAGRLAKRLVDIMARANPRLHVRTLDLDQYPGLAHTYGVHLYNVAVLESSGRRLQVVSTDDRTPSSLPPSSSSRAGSLSPATRPVCALRRGAACRRPPGRAARGVQADPSTGWARWSVEKAV